MATLGGDREGDINDYCKNNGGDSVKSNYGLYAMINIVWCIWIITHISPWIWMLIFFFLKLKLALLSTQTDKGKNIENSHLKIPHPQSEIWPHNTFSNSIRNTFSPQSLLHSPPSWCKKIDYYYCAFCNITKIYIPYFKRNLKGKRWVSNHETIKEPVVPNSSACVVPVPCGGVSSYQELGTNRDKVNAFPLC